ncbi:DUF535 family protein [Helicobacter sp. 11S02596-1]|uniref:DUF535 family protein n=1 Tax=Helicobacter sp. 11S02596-1 TaxID=1476194 RepID=UPI0015E04988|nr:DUF535 family protein [Helicobacter sp. 11S02596-1]
MRRYFRFYLRKIAFYSYVLRFEKFINKNPFLIDLIQSKPMSAYVLIKCFCNRKFNAKERFKLIISDLSFMQKFHFNSGILPLWKNSIEIFSIDAKNPDDTPYILSLEANPLISEEGFWALILKNTTRGGGGSKLDLSSDICLYP